MANSTQVPDGWRVVRLGDVVDVAFSGVDKKTVDGEIPIQLCNYTDVFYNRLIQAGMRFMKATATPKECNRWALKQGDVLFTKDSETPDELGIPALVTENMPNVLCGYHLGMARPRAKVIDGQFLAEALGSQAARRKFARIANGITRFGLTLDATRSLPILLPPFREQRGIAAVLDAIDEAIERTEAVISATEHLRDALLHDLLTRGVPGWHTQWRTVPGLGTIPADWQVVRLEDVADIQTGRAVNRKATQTGRLEVPYLSVANVKDGYLDLGVVKTMRVSDRELCRFRLRNGDVLFTEGGDADKLGRGTVWREEIDPCLHQNHVFAVRPHESQLTPGFLAAYAASSAGKRYFLGAAKQTTNLASVNSTQLKRMVLPLPKLKEQIRITEILAAGQKARLSVSTSRDCLRTTKTAAADVLLTGRVRALISMATLLG